jgi:uncharacterized membrane protein YfcA
MQRILFLIAAFIAYLLHAITGFAGNMFAMPAGIHTIGMHDSILALNVMGICACGMLVITDIKAINWREFSKIIAVMLVFMLVGIWINTVLALPVLIKVFGVIIILVALKNLFLPDTKDLPEWVLWLTLAAAGITQGMFLAGGAFLVIYAVQKLKEKQEFRITLSLVWTVLNLIYAGIAIGQGQFSSDILPLVLACIPVALVSTWFGNRIAKRVSPERFFKLTFVFLLVIGVLLLYTSAV